MLQSVCVCVCVCVFPLLLSDDFASTNYSHLSTQECLSRHLKIHFSVYTIATSYLQNVCLGSEAFPLENSFFTFFYFVQSCRWGSHSLGTSIWNNAVDIYNKDIKEGLFLFTVVQENKDKLNHRNVLLFVANYHFRK